MNKKNLLKFKIINYNKITARKVRIIKIIEISNILKNKVIKIQNHKIILNKVKKTIMIIKKMSNKHNK